MRDRARAMGWRLLVAVIAVLALARCAGTDPEGAPPVEAGAAAPVGSTEAVLSTVADLVAHHAGLATRVAAHPPGGGFVLDGEGYTSPAWRTAPAPGVVIGGRAPVRLSEGLRVGLGGAEVVGLTLFPVGAAEAAVAEADQGRLVYRDAWPGVDLVLVSGEDHVEWLYVLHDAARAPRSLELGVTLGPAVAGLELELTGSYLARDAEGVALFRITRPFLIDAAGVQRDAGMEYRDGLLRIQVDTAGLAFPVLVDPAVETAAWELRSSPPPSRSGHAMAYDSARDRVVVFGGTSAVTYADTWEYDGTRWTLRSTTGPSARSNAAATYDPVRARTVLYGGPDDSTWLWDGTVWTEACTGACSRPGHRDGASMTWVPGRDRATLFGGTDGAGASTQETWEWDGTSWSRRATGGPPARFWSQLTYDAARGEAILFGGFNSVAYLGDTWGWNGTTWTLRASTGPQARNNHHLAYHAGSAKVILFSGGTSSGSVPGDTWEWNGTTWTQLTPGTSPGGRSAGAMVAATARNRLVLFAGVFKGDTWEWDGTTWSEPPIPGPRYEEAAAFDSVRGRFVLFGGTRQDTWEWDGFSWSKACTSPACTATLPAPQYGYAMTFDPTRGRTLLYGGMDFYPFEWTGSAWLRLCTGAPCTSSPRPAQKIDPALAYDTVRQRALLFGGFDVSAAPSNELWEWDGTVWTQRCTGAPCNGTVPAPRYDAEAAFDTSRGVLVVFGGRDAGGAPRSDLWEWNGTSWTERCNSAPCNLNKPLARGSFSATFDRSRGRVIIFGGTNAGVYLGDTWEWDGTAFARTDAGGAAGSPPRRRAHSAGQDDARRRMVMFGGIGDNGTTYGDTWEYHVRGNGCITGSTCATGFCVDGVCCESTQCGTCQACDTAGSPGVCAAVTGADDLDSCTGVNTCSAQGACLKENGQTCTTATQCASGSCADGYCCNAPCAGGCDVCSATPGTCTLRAAGNAGADPACGGFACTGTAGACPTTCAADAQCASGFYCAVGGTCQPRRAQGQTCNTAAGGDCATAGCAECQGSLSCVDFVCCSSACSGTCQTCAGGTPGTCQTLTTGTDPGTCVAPNQCSAGGACRKQNGQTCTIGTECASGSCADGTCCNTACGGGCDLCTTGTCTNQGAGAAGTGCGQYLCAGAAACPTSCASDAGCATTSYCRTSDSTCQPDQVSGAACTSGAQCTSGSCVDGVCCASACTGACQACSVGKTGVASGTCAPITAGSDPDSECTTDAPSTCSQDGTCNGAGACRRYVAGTSCGTTTCAAGTQSVYTCNGSGTCNATPGACSPYACNGATACHASCTGDAQCAGGFYCAVGNVCTAKAGAGAACTGANQCISGFCADGVCCDGACGGACQACTAAKKGSGSNGTCGTVASGTDPDSECAADTGNACGQSGACSGAGACQIAAAGTTCGATTCASGIQTGQQCNGSGLCQTGGSAPCPTGYTCLNGSVCATSCSADAHCTAAYHCRTTDGTCQPDLGNGGACTAAAQCQSGNCVDGVCCDAPCGGACSACTAARKGAGADGTCGPVAVDTDPDGECASELPDTCGLNGSCDGVGQCKRWPFGTSCGTATCSGGLRTGYACNGSGTCVAGTSSQCSPYECATASACATTCTGDAQCVAAYHCRLSDGTCQPDLTQGAACTGAGQCASGFCADGVCCDGACTGLCSACSAARKGSGADGSCGPVAAGSDPDSDCPSESATSCGRTGQCNGSGECSLHAPGTVCGSTTCSAGQQTGYSCDGFGSCRSGASTTCSPFVCADALSCGTSCGSDADCVASAFCSSQSALCVADQVNGGACTAGAQCVSGFCADGVCCAQACTGTCEACSAAAKGGGADGVCGPVAAGSDPASECSDEGAASCGFDGTCNGFGQCGRYVAGTACGATTCTPSALGGTQTGFTCNGSGSCQGSASTQCGPYVCQGAQCGAACAVDADCIATHHCRLADGTCQPDLAPGAACTGAAQCASGSCADGVCCDAPCAGTCEGCSAAVTGGVDGACAPIRTGTDPDGDCAAEDQSTCQRTGQCDGARRCALHASGTVCGVTTCAGGSQSGQACDGLGACQPGQSTACAPYVCQGSACGVSCGGDVDCVAGAYCSGAGACLPDQPGGAACTAGAQCVSGHCVDGVCCDTACTGTCAACSAARKGAGLDGECGVVMAGADPDGECASESPGTCGSNGSCDGSGACARWALGTSCGQNTCGGSLGATLTGQQCDGFGGCVGGQVTDCAPFRCQGDSCLSACSLDDDCVLTAWCDAGVCRPRVGNGAACLSGSACQTGFCVEGVCCNTACDGTCQACRQATKADASADGLCGDAATGEDPHGDCATEDPNACGRDGTCDGAGACRLYGQGSPCGAVACNGNAPEGFTCNGTGTCSSGLGADCAPYACAGGACRTACLADGDCATTAFCDTATGQCAARSPDGATCSSTSECQSGFCVDGVCCESVCSGQCQACDLPGALGACSPVIGAPRGARAACPGAPGTAPDQRCQARLCDGTRDVTQCVAFVGPDVGCRDQACADGTQTFSAACDGRGACGSAEGGTITRRCAPYVCDPQGLECRNDCTADAECSGGTRCDTASGQCVASTTCDGDHTLTDPLGNATDCSPFRCEPTGACIDRCDSTQDCIAGYVCNADRLCVSPQGATGAAADDGGCGCRVPVGTGGRPGGAALIALGVAALGRRRRQGRPATARARAGRC